MYLEVRLVHKMMTVCMAVKNLTLDIPTVLVLSHSSGFTNYVYDFGQVTKHLPVSLLTLLMSKMGIYTVTISR